MTDRKRGDSPWNVDDMTTMDIRAALLMERAELLTLNPTTKTRMMAELATADGHTTRQ